MKEYKTDLYTQYITMDHPQDDLKIYFHIGQSSVHLLLCLFICPQITLKNVPIFSLVLTTNVVSHDPRQIFFVFRVWGCPLRTSWSHTWVLQGIECAFCALFGLSLGYVGLRFSRKLTWSGWRHLCRKYNGHRGHCVPRGRDCVLFCSSESEVVFR